jgi:TonB family protein
VKALIESGADVNTERDEYGRTALMLASEKNHLGVVKALLAANADLEAKDNTGETALIDAAWGDHLEMVRTLLAAHADLESGDKTGDTALMLASAHGHVSVALALLAAKAKVDARDSEGETPLMVASRNDEPAVVRLLLAAKADVNAKADDGSTALMMAAQKGNAEVVRLLRTAGATGDVIVQQKPCYAKELVYAEFTGNMRPVGKPEYRNVEVPCAQQAGGRPAPQAKGAKTKAQRITISAGQALGMLLQKAAPKYPPIAKAARVSGTVVLQVTISDTGAVKEAHVLSGPAMLQQAAVDAVKAYRYRPYTRNNERPIEVETTVNVTFTLDN